MSGPSNSSSTVEDAQTTARDLDIDCYKAISEEWELDIAIAKEIMGGFSEESVLSITSKPIIPVAAVDERPSDTDGGGIIKTIDASKMHDGQMIFLNRLTSSAPLTIAHLATGGSGAPIATFTGKDIVLTDQGRLIWLKYSATANQFREILPCLTRIS